jgi:hypothetical protein
MRVALPPLGLASVYDQLRPLRAGAEDVAPPAADDQVRAALDAPIGMACGRTISPGSSNFRELRSKTTAPAHLTLAGELVP